MHLHHNLNKYFVYMKYKLMILNHNMEHKLDKNVHHFDKYNNLNFDKRYIVCL